MKNEYNLVISKHYFDSYLNLNILAETIILSAQKNI